MTTQLALQILGVLYAVLNIVNALLKNPAKKNIVGEIMDVIAFLTRKDASGTLKLPVFQRSGTTNGIALPPAVLVLSLSALLSSSCIFGQAWKKCELGALPQNVQVVEACVMGAITSIADWRAEVLSCGTGLLPGQIDCLVKAITTWADGALKTTPAGNTGSIRAMISQRGHAWLKDHPATACGDAPYSPTDFAMIEQFRL